MHYLTQVAEQPLHRALGLTDWEADRIQELLGREPNHFELAVFSLLWSEHCGYKHSAPLLKRLPSGGERVLQGPGENAGVLDLGEGVAVTFKVESHNHPSAVEPFQGAATGIGGILRDIIAMGARPIALLDGLWFGAPDHQFERAVAGIGGYGNSVGVANVGGATVFHEAYAGNCLVNAMCVGLLDSGRLQSAKAQGPGNVVVLYGATTGRDGIGGASVLASQELGEDDADKRPSVQVGDPFTGKKLIEVSVELVESGLVESLQDCGAAGLASALSEMARDGAGIDVPPRPRAVARRGHGAVGDHDLRVAGADGRRRAAADARRGAGGLRPLGAPPRCDRRGHRHTPAARVPRRRRGRRDSGTALDGRVPALRGRTGGAQGGRLGAEAAGAGRHRAWIVEQYDQLVGSRTVRRPGLDAAVLRLRPSLRGIAVALQGPRPGESDPFAAGVQAVLGAARNVACAGGEPIGLTDCLNFGNPEKPEIAYELAQAIEGIAQAAEALGIPVVSGNVSLYNETDGRSIPPTPVVGCVGLVPDVRLVPARWETGDVVLLAQAPEASLAAEAALIRFLWKAAPLLSLCHDVGYGGLEHALAEAARWSGREADVDLPVEPAHGAAILATSPDQVARLGSKGFVQIGEVR